MRFTTLTSLVLVAFLVIGLTGLVPPACAQGSLPLWTNYYNGPANGNDQANAIAVDGSGNAFVTGYSQNSFGGYGIVTIKYSSTGVPLWIRRYSQPGEVNEAKAIAVDRSGNVFVAGYSVSSGGELYYETIKYSGAGALLWVNRYDGPSGYGSTSSAVAVDSSGNVFVTGLSNDSNRVPHFATIKYSAAGAPLWTNICTAVNRTDAANAIALDANGNLFVAGWTSAGNGIGPYYWLVRENLGGTGAWATVDTVSGEPHAIAADNSGHVFVSGQGFWLVRRN